MTTYDATMNVINLDSCFSFLKLILEVFKFIYILKIIQLMKVSINTSSVNVYI